MWIRNLLILVAVCIGCSTAGIAADPFAIRPPAVPLVACDPYFSIWSQHDRLNDGPTTHWTGKPHRLTSVATIDGKAYRLLGGADDLAGTSPLPQADLEITPTKTIATFKGSGVSIRMSFLTPALPEDIDLLSRPVTYVTWDAVSIDDKPHAVAVTFSASGEIAVNTPDQEVAVDKVPNVDGLSVVRVGSVEQAILAKAGDDLRIDWGYLYLASPKFQFVDTTVASKTAMGAPGGNTRLQMSADFGTVGNQSVSRWLMLAYDDLYSIQYMQKNLRPYWRRNGWDAMRLLQASANEREALLKRCESFDRELTTDLTQAGSEAYARLGALAYRQCFAAGKFVADAKGQPLQFCKENHSNGCIATSDVFYPMAPQFLLLGPSLSKSFLIPFMNYAASDRWQFPFAPHDLGTYPLANGQVYGGGERTETDQMPVEESGNLLVLFCAVAQMEGNADFAGLYWPQLVRWAEYLRQKGFDPENQLCTDDFAGHLAHNVNLSAKAICGLGAFAKLCEMRGEQALATEYRKVAKEFADKWVNEAQDGDHFRLAFDRQGTWSQKYNLVWDRILGLDLFPDSVRRKEMDFYLRMQNQYGLPLDNRKEYTKLDWILWTATLTQDRKDFDALLAPIDRFIRETSDRSPLTDWYETKSGRKVGFTARPVLGGIFLQMLYDRATWGKYAKRDQSRASNWAPLPKPPKIVDVVPTSEKKPAQWRYVTNEPKGDWIRPEFQDRDWRQGSGGFGTRNTPNTIIGTEWNSPDIWIRREFELKSAEFTALSLRLHHDESVEVYINGVLAATLTGYTTSYGHFAISDAARAALVQGKNVLAIHCHQTLGGQYVDAGLVDIQPAESE